MRDRGSRRDDAAHRQRAAGRVLNARPGGEAIVPLIRAAGESGALPAWAHLDEARRNHTERVVALLDEWGRRLGSSEDDLVRWRAAGYLHDALKSTPPVELRDYVGPGESWPDPVLHGPACAARLRLEGVDDEPLLSAIAYHSTGHPDLDLLGRMLYLADYLEPGRKRESERAAALRDRLPVERVAVLREVVAARIGYLLDQRLPILRTTIEFWNRLAREVRANE